MATRNSTEGMASSGVCRDSRSQSQVLGELGLDPLRKQPQELKISRKPREKAKNPQENTSKRTPPTLPGAPEVANEKQSQQL